MRWMTLLGVVASLGMTSGLGMAAEAPKLPNSAKLLKADDIIKLYGGATLVYNNFTNKKPVMGHVTYDFQAMKTSGDYVMGSDKGTFKGTLRMKGDMFCYKIGKETCVSVYLDGADIYEVDAKGIVTSKNSKQ